MKGIIVKIPKLINEILILIIPAAVYPSINLWIPSDPNKMPKTPANTLYNSLGKNIFSTLSTIVCANLIFDSTVQPATCGDNSTLSAFIK